MLEWLDGLAGPQFATAVIWTLAALIVLVLVLVIVKMIRSLTFGTFVAGGRNRKTRLAVMDATAVDSHRRLVLVRRDDVEHLILIGGPTDVVVEREIRLGGQPRRAALTADNGHETPPPPPPARPRQPEPVPARPPVQQQAPRHERPAPPPQRAMERPQPAPPPARPQQPRPVVREPAPQQRQAPPRMAAAPAPAPASAAPAPRHVPAAPASRSNNLDDALLKELEVGLNPTGRPPAKPGEMSLDDEMTRLLGELSSQKR